jgi:hypothetical protein
VERIAAYGKRLYDKRLYDKRFYDKRLYDKRLYDKRLYDKRLYDKRLYDFPIVYRPSFTAYRISAILSLFVAFGTCLPFICFIRKANKVQRAESSVQKFLLPELTTRMNS